MSFVSIEFSIFFAMFFLVFHCTAGLTWVRNTLILGGSYFFYGWWDWRFLGLVILSTTIDYFAGRLIEKSPERKRWAVLTSVGVNLTILGFFKYYNFFAESFAEVLTNVGMHADDITLDIILPIGISFYTFQSMAYTIDVARGNVAAERNPLIFFSYVSFFPQLVAGPIERPAHMLPQFHSYTPPTYDQIVRALWLIVWGYFLKVVVADSLAAHVDVAFSERHFHVWSVILGTVAFGLQIFGDFCGYSLIAKGLAGLLGFDLMWNFKAPYWSTSVREFWHRWHISLSTWLRDYLYMPLGGSLGPSWVKYRNLMITMVLGGLWHGASWTFVIWGAIHGLALCANHAYRKTIGQRFEMPAIMGWFLTMSVVFVGWFFFRVGSWEQVVFLYNRSFFWTWENGHTFTLGVIIALCAPVILVEWLQKRDNDYSVFERFGVVTRSVALGVLLIVILAATDRVRGQFVYFQF